MFNTRHIELHLPKSWNSCTTEELEHIAAAIILEQRRQNRYHPFDWHKVKLMSVLSINHIEVVSQPVPVVKDYSHDDTYLLRRSKEEEPWPITIGQLYSLTEQLSWIDDENSDKTVFAFPYPELSVSSGSAAGKETPLVGPPPLLDGYTWQEYRWLTDWMQEYMRCENAKRDSSTARNEFLAVLFKRNGRNSNITEARNNDTLDAALFTGFGPVKWQVILFWWSSLMLMLSKKFPKVFKDQPVSKKKREQKNTPWDFYNCVIATIQKYVGGLSENEVNAASYGTILQQLEMMAIESEEMDKISKNNKHKK